MKPQDVVAIILAVAVFAVFFTGTSAVKHMVGVTTADLPNDKMLGVWNNLLFTLIGGLMVYIAGGDK